MTTHPRSAELTLAADGSGAPRVVAEGVPSARRSGPRPGDGRRIVGWLVMRAPNAGTTPRVRSWCVCGRNLGAVGYGAGGRLIADHKAHRDVCPEQAAEEDRRAA
ncbi:hypothetical protein [Streptomyces erythrochromogenes]|uniref:hypothetical protein n=1 Tax=Streptomyces erythrochromogenes TaxID=285574 RepID=UPI001FD75561|nr:hypothetical protein [Streptomyces erythrochromogenes]